MADLAALLATAPPADGAVTVIEPPDTRSVGVFAFTAHHVIAAQPAVLHALAERTGRVVNNVDAVLVGRRGSRNAT